jgi:16S rRNA (adenine1518-N6/adenine1519-N6)-dimethyltransferase
MYAKKSLGQHFLTSVRALDAIIEAGKLNCGETILEIGPGKGVLTERLLKAGAHVIAVEKDNSLFESLQEKFAKEIREEQLELVHEDILDFDIKKSGFKSYKIIANIPYNITGAIIEKFLSEEIQPALMVLLVQKEVAQRIVAREGKESILSLSVKAYGLPRYVETVKAGSFAPAPQVDSAIIAIEGISKGFFANFDEKSFFKLLHAGFQAKRKKLSSNLSVIFDKNEVKKAFEALNLDENTRAEDVDIAIWQKLAETLV